MKRSCWLLASVLLLGYASTPPSLLAIKAKDCGADVDWGTACPCPYPDRCDLDTDTTFRCSVPPECDEDTLICESQQPPDFDWNCDESRGCALACCDSSRITEGMCEPLCVPSASQDSCSDADQCAFCSELEERTVCCDGDVECVDACMAASDPGGCFGSDSAVCPGTIDGPPLIGQPERDPFHYGLLTLKKLTASDVTFHLEDPDGDGATDEDADGTHDGPACHFGTNCNLVYDNDKRGVSIVEEATFPEGTQVVAGKARWRSGHGPAIVDKVFTNVFVPGGGNAVCMDEGGRQLWCPIPLLRHRYKDCPNPCDYDCDNDGVPACEETTSGDSMSPEPLGQFDPAHPQKDCSLDCSGEGARTCFCTDACHLRAFWDEMVAASGASHSIDLGEEWMQVFSCGANPLSGNAEFTGGPGDPNPLLPGSYGTIHVDDNVAAVLKTGVYTVCNLIVDAGASVDFEVDPANPLVTMFARSFNVNGASFAWTPPGSFAWVGPQATEKIPPSDVRVAIPESIGILNVTEGSNMNGIFVAPAIEVSAFDANLRGSLLAYNLEVHPRNVYCGCRAPGASCRNDSDCCHGNCTPCDGPDCNDPCVGAECDDRRVCGAP